MKTFFVTVLVGLSLIGAVDSVSAQRSGRDYGSDEREDGGRGYEGRGDDRDDDGRRPERRRSYDDDRGNERDRGYDDRRDRQRGRGYDDGDRGRELRRGNGEDREAEFDEEEYLRCHADVRRAVERGEMKSGAFHYKMFGRREGRRLTCEMKL